MEMRNSTDKESKPNPTNGRYYWIKLFTNFFDSDDVRVIEAQQNGEKYLILWLKLLLKAIEQEELGVLRYKAEIPYTPEILATVTHTDVDMVRSALALFQKMGLIEIDEAGSILIEAVQPMVGSVTSSAIRMRKLRARKAAKQLEDKSQKGASQSDVEIEIEKQKERDEEVEKIGSEQEKTSSSLPSVAQTLHNTLNLTTKVQDNSLTRDIFQTLKNKKLLTPEYFSFVAQAKEMEQFRDEDGKLETGPFLVELSKATNMGTYRKKCQRAAADAADREVRNCRACGTESTVGIFRAIGCPLCLLKLSDFSKEERVQAHRFVAINDGKIQARDADEQARMQAWIEEQDQAWECARQKLRSLKPPEPKQEETFEDIFGIAE
jgi:predicted phage replisome organizer